MEIFLQYIDVAVLICSLAWFGFKLQASLENQENLLNKLINRLEKSEEKSSSEHKEMMKLLNSMNNLLELHLKDHERIQAVLERIRESQLVNDTKKNKEGQS